MRTGLGIGIASSAGGVGAPSAEATFLAYQNQTPKAGMWDPTGGSTMWSTNLKSTEIVAGSGDPVGIVESMTDHAFDMNYYNFIAGRRALATDGLTTDSGTNFHYTLDIPGGAGSTNMAVLMLVKTTDNKAALLVRDAGSPLFIFPIQDGIGTAILLDLYANDTLYEAGVATQDDYHTAVATGANTLCEVRSVNLSGNSRLEVGTSQSQGAGVWQYDGSVLAMCLIDLAAQEAIAAGQGALALAAGQAWLTEIAGN